jgi:hypothetical protein
MPKTFEESKKESCIKAIREGRVARLWNDRNYNAILPQNVKINQNNLPTPRRIFIPRAIWDADEGGESEFEKEVMKILPRGTNAYLTGEMIDSPNPELYGWTIQFYELMLQE